MKKLYISKNKFYSILALNTIIEKNLSINKNEILNYFDILENRQIIQKNKQDIINFKKALFLIKNSEKMKGKKLLNNLIKNDSNLNF